MNNDSKVCNGWGECTGPNQCSCIENYSGSNCDSYYCGGTMMNQSTVCSGKGACVSSNVCNMFVTAQKDTLEALAQITTVMV